MQLRRVSGGVALLVRKELSRFVDRIHTEYDNIIILKLSKQLLGTESEVVLLGSYTPPANSVYYKETEITNGISLTEQCIKDVIETVGDLPLTAFGELNARTGSENATETNYDCENATETNYDCETLIFLHRKTKAVLINRPCVFQRIRK